MPARSAGEAYLRAAVAYHFSKFVWVLEPERNRANTVAAARSLYAAHELLDPTAERIQAPLDGATVVANLRLPPNGGPWPLVVLIPGLDSTKEEFFIWESVFLTRGMATLSLDGPGQGETGFALDIRADYEVAVAAILDAVAGRPELDSERIGAAGVSLGGHYVIRAGAFEPRLRAIAGVSGPYDLAAGWDTMPSLTRETIAHHTGSDSETEARQRAHELNLAGVAELRRAAVPGRDRQARPRDRLGADQADRRRGTRRRVGALRRRHARLQQHPLQVPAARRRLDAPTARMIGEPVRRREDERILRGLTSYVDDIDLPEAGHLAFVRSPHARASITAIRAPATARA